MAKCARRRGPTTMIALAALLSIGCDTACESQREGISTEAMLDQFETVFRSDTAFVLGKSGLDGISEEHSDSFRVPFGLLLMALEALPAASKDDLFGRVMRFSLVRRISTRRSDWEQSGPRPVTLLV